MELRIGNSGAAIPLEAHERIFEKFGQVERADHSNFGLGLYFCRLVLEAHGGRISVDSEPRLPTVFVLAIPKTRARAART